MAYRAVGSVYPLGVSRRRGLLWFLGGIGASAVGTLESGLVSTRPATRESSQSHRFGSDILFVADASFACDTCVWT